MSDVTQRTGAALVLWLCGSGLRLTILALPPVIVAVQRDLALTGTEVGLLSGIPIVFFAAAAVPGSLLIARLGVVPTLVTGLIVTAFGSAARSLAASAWPFYAATMLMSVGVAMMQPAMPAAVRDWLPSRIGFATALYTNGMIVGEILPAAMMLPIVVPLMGDSWRAAIAIWSVPLLLIALFASLVAPRDRLQEADSELARVWWPEWRDPLIWRLGFILSSVNSTYFCSNAFLPAHLSSADTADLISPALTALNFGQLPASILLLTLAARLEARVWPD